jgi:hypothetical protein
LFTPVTRISFLGPKAIAPILFPVPSVFTMKPSSVIELVPVRK